MSDPAAVEPRKPSPGTQSLYDVLVKWQWLPGSDLESVCGFVFDRAWDAAVVALWYSCINSTWPRVVASGAFFWCATAATKVVDDMVDGDGPVGDAARNAGTAKTFAASAFVVAFGCACVVSAAALSPQAALAMAAQATGCILAGKIDCWQHAVTTAAIAASLLLWGPALASAGPWLAMIVAAAFVDELVHDAADASPSAPGLKGVVRALARHRVLADSMTFAVCAASGMGSQAAVMYFDGYEGVEPWLPAVGGALHDLAGKLPAPEQDGPKSAVERESDAS